MIDAPPVAGKKRWPRAEAISVARDICAALQPVTERLIVAGSLRRRRADVGDVEILYVPKLETEQADMFSTREANLVNRQLDEMIFRGTLRKRPNVNGAFAWGAKNKLALAPNGIPVDLFEATNQNWFNYLVCRTGGADNNVRIAQAAIARGWQWHPYDNGFSSNWTKGLPQQHKTVTSEREVFEFVGLPYLEPWER